MAEEVELVHANLIQQALVAYRRREQLREQVETETATLEYLYRQMNGVTKDEWCVALKEECHRQYGGG